MKRLKILLIVNIFTIFFIMTKMAYASGYSLSINPPIIKIKVTPSASVKTGIRIKNLSDKTVVLGYVLKPFRSGNDGKNQVKYLLYKDYTNQDRNFLQKINIFEKDLSVSNIILAPKQEKNLTLAIDFSKEEKPMDHYFSIVFLTQNQDKLDSSYSHIVEGIGTNVLVSINPKDYKAEIQDFSTSSLVSGGPVKFDVKIKNIGDHFITTSGYILIKNIFGQIIGKVDLETTNVLAKSTVKMSSKGNNDIIWPEKFLLGSYGTKLYINYENSPTLLKEIRFLAMPTKQIIVLTIIGIIIIFIRKRAKN